MSEEKENRKHKFIDEPIIYNGSSYTNNDLLKDYSIIKLDGESIDSITEKVNEAKKINPHVAIIGGGAGNSALLEAIIRSKDMKGVTLVVEDVNEMMAIREHEQSFAFAQRGSVATSKKGDVMEILKSDTEKLKLEVQKYHYDDEELNRPMYGTTKNRKNGGNKKIKKRKKAKNGRTKRKK